MDTTYRPARVHVIARTRRLLRGADGNNFDAIRWNRSG
jgi:hypothetical protein